MKRCDLKKESNVGRWNVSLASVVPGGKGQPVLHRAQREAVHYVRKGCRGCFDQFLDQLLHTGQTPWQTCFA